MTGTHVTTTSYARSRDNALRHGVLAESMALPWEEPGAFDELHASVAAEYAPRGPIECYLVEELAAVLWRRRRLSLAERAAHGRSLREVMENGVVARAAVAHSPSRPDSFEWTETAVCADPDETAAELAGVVADEAAARRALETLEAGGADAVGAALRALPDRHREAVVRRLARRLAPDDPMVVQCVLSDHVLAPLVRRRRQLEIRPLVRAQARADAATGALEGPHARYEAHLDRKFLRMLATLLRLQSLRNDSPTTTS